MSLSLPSARTTRRLLAAAVLGLAPALAACGSSSPAASLPKAAATTQAPGTSGTSTPSSRPSLSHAQLDDVMAKFNDCMAAHGNGPVVPGQPAPSAAPNQGSIDDSFKACNPILIKAGVQPMGDGGHGLPADVQKQFLDVAKCMRDRGWNTPDPDFSGGGAMMRTPTDPAAQKDQNDCMAKYGPKMGTQ